MRTVDVVIPSMGKLHALDCIRSLKSLPFAINLHFVTEGNSWPEAINIGLAESKNDVILMDDDIRLCEDTFKDFEKYYDKANIFGFKLLYGDGKTIQHAGGICRNKQLRHLGWAEKDEGQFDTPLYCCHVTTSLIYIKREVLDNLKGMDESYPGYQFEDVDFNFRALRMGYKLLYIPSPATHLESHSKKHLEDFQDKMEENFRLFKDRYFNDGQLMTEVESYPKEYK